MNRLLSRREKDGTSHRRQKSRDKFLHHSDKKEHEKKVTCSTSSFLFCASLTLSTKSVFNQSVFQLSAAFPNPHEKARPSIQPSVFCPIVTISTDNRFGPVLQIQPPPSDFIGLFKFEPQRKLDGEQEVKVHCPLERPVSLLMKHR